MTDDSEAYEPNAGAFSKSRSHIIMIIGVMAAAGFAYWLERLNPENCKPVASPSAVELSLDRV